MFCPHCGSQLHDGTKFCPYCGAKLPSITPNAPAAPEPPDQPAPTAQQTPATTPVSNQTPQPTASQPVPPAQPAPSPKSRKRIPTFAIVIIAALVIGGAAFAITNHIRVLNERSSSNASIGYGTGGASGSSNPIAAKQYDYFYSTAAGGIVKGDPDNGSTEVIYPVDSQQYTVTAMALDGNTLYFAYQGYSAQAAETQIRAINTDGTNERELSNNVESSMDTKGYFQISQLHVFNQRLYLLGSLGGTGNRSCAVASMKEDGSDFLHHADIDGISGTDGVAITPDYIFWSTSPYGAGSGSTSSIKRMNIMGGDEQTIYTSSASNINNLAAIDGRLYLQEDNGSAGRMTITSTDLDGGNASTLYESPANTSARLIAAAQGSLFLMSYDTADERNQIDVLAWDLVKVSTSDGSATTIAKDLDIYNPVVSDLGGRLLMTENGQYAGSMGLRAISVDYDGNTTVEYKVGQS